MHCKQWIFDMDGTLTDSMVVVWEGAPEALLARFGRTPKADLHETLLTMGMEEGAQYLIREYALPLDRNGYLDVMREVIAQLYEKVELKPGVRDTLARLRAEGARMCICSNTWSSQCRTVLTRLGIDEYFDFYIEARGAMSKSSPAPFMEALHRLGRARWVRVCALRCPDRPLCRPLSGGHSGHHQRCRRPRFAPHLRPVPAGLDCTGLGAGVRFHKTATVRRSCNPGAAGV